MERGNSQLPLILSVTGSLAGLNSSNLGRDNQIMNYFQKHLTSIRNRSIQWEVYRNAELINEKELDVLKKINSRVTSSFESLLETHGEEIMVVLFRILKDLRNEEAIEVTFALLIEHLDDTCRILRKLNSSSQEYVPILFR